MENHSTFNKLSTQAQYLDIMNDPLHKKTNKNLAFQPGPTQTSLYSHRSRLED